MIHPPNVVDISRNGHGGVSIIVDGHELAPHVEDWSIAHDRADPILTVTIRCSHLSVDLPEQPITSAPSRDVRGGCA